jgi:hypothetical protein
MFLSNASIEVFFSKIKVPFDCEFFVAQSVTKKENREIKISLTEVYQYHTTRALQKHTVAHWTSNSGFIWTASSLLRRRANLHGIPIRVGVPNSVSAERLFV